MARLQGAFTALVTPMREDGSVDFEGFRKLVQTQLAAGITGLLPLGTTGETPTLTEDEEEALSVIAVEECRAVKDRYVPVILGAGSNCTRDSVRYAQRAKKIGADYVLVVTPYYNKPSDEGVYRHFEAVSAVGIPIIIYNIGGRTGKNLSASLIDRIADLPCIAGVKEASGSLPQMMDIISVTAKRKPDFSVLSGDDALTLPLIAAGGDGVISVISNAAPKEIQAMTAAALAGDFSQARELHYRLLPLMKAAFIETNPCPIKYAMERLCLPSGTLRLPLVPITQESRAVVDAALQSGGLL